MKKYFIFYILVIIAIVSLSVGCQQVTKSSSDSPTDKAEVSSTETPDDLPTGAKEKTSGEYVREIDRILSDDKYDKAFEMTKEALEKDPDHRGLQMLMGISLNHQKKYKEAVEYFTQSLEAGNGSRENYIYRGDAYFYLGEYDKAIDDYSKVIKILTDFSSLYYHRGIAYIYNGEMEKGMKDFNKAVELDEDQEDEKPYENRGMAYLIKGQYKKAIEDLKKSIEIDPEFVQGRTTLGFAYILDGKNKEGIEELDRALKLDPNHAEAYYFRGYANLKSGNEDKAEKDFKKGKSSDKELEGITLIKMISGKYGDSKAGGIAGEIISRIDTKETVAK